MSFIAKLQRAREALEQQQRLSLRALGRELELEDAALEEIAFELVDVQGIARREGSILVWSGPQTTPHPAPAASELAKTAPAAVPAAAAERNPLDYTPRHLAEKILSSQSAIEGERKQVTVLFADVKGSMALAEETGPEAWHEILDHFFRILSAGVHRFEGTVNQYTGDGIMALFGAPIAHEDHAQRACFAALHLRDAVREYANEVRVRHGVSLGVRIGLNSGDVVVGKIGDDLRMDYTAQGHVVGLAQRMEALAESGHTCVAERTARLVEGYFQLEDLGRVQVKGVPEPVQIYDLQGVGPFRTRLDRSRARGLSAFVGRNDEMAALDAALESSLDGQMRVVGVVADAGVGKSRLCLEFVERCRSRGLTVNEAHCPAHGRSVPLLPILELYRGYFGIGPTDEPQAAREKIAGRLLLLDRDFESSLPLVWDFLHVPDPERPVEEMGLEARQRQLTAVVQRVARARSERESMVILIDDLHWIDSASDGFLAQLIEALRGTRTLLLGNFRPEYRADWMQQRDYQQLPLTPLSSDAIRDLVSQLLGADESVATLPEVIERQTAGNPFFTEEVVQTLIESGHLEGERGAYRLVSPIDRLEIPDSVQSVLAARIDRLSERDKHVLQHASVIGKNFAQPLLAQIAGLPENELEAGLSSLCAADFLYERELYPVAEYEFKHPLTHDVAYGSQLAEKRRSVHGALAQFLDAEANADPSLLAHHWEAADVPERAARSHRDAAERMGFLDADATLRHWQRVRDLVPRLEDSEENLILASAAHAQILWTLIRVGTEPEPARALYDSAVKLAERAGDDASLTRARFIYSNYLLYSGQPGALALARDAVRAADRSGQIEIRVGARWAACLAAYFGGDMTNAEQICSEALAVTAGDFDVGSSIVGYSAELFLLGMHASLCAQQGRLSESQRDLENVLVDRGARYRAIRPMACAFGVLVHEVHGDSRQALALATAAIEEFHGQPNTAAGEVWVYHCHGLAQLLAGHPKLALASLERSARVAEEAGTFLHLAADTDTVMAETHLALGGFGEARTLLARAFEHGEFLTSVRRIHAHLCRSRLLLAEGSSDFDAVDADILAAEEAATRAGAHGSLPEVWIARGAALLARGDAAGHQQQLEQAATRYEEMGAPLQVERISRLLAAAG